MARTLYRLDDLSWLQFEELIQLLLKARLGFTESWGGHWDGGNDVYSKGPLCFPGELENKGPFVFQAKFVENANAPGAKVKPAVIKAVRSEVGRLRDRIARKKWQQPSNYGLFTNAPLSESLKTEINHRFATELKDVVVHSFGGGDVSNWLDICDKWHSSFPQLLSARNLEALLSNIVDKSIVQRTRSAISEMGDRLRSFVPTAAYYKTLQVLEKHHFAVLQGPPEVGKTSIAWAIAIALSQSSHGWQPVDCAEPQDFYTLLNPDRRQIFVVDDAFGTTEYDPSRGKTWEREIHKILKALDGKHWLLWTSRLHILERAKREMDLQGNASRFPEPGTVLVSVSELSEQEKALILYQHARSHNLEDEAKQLIRSHCIGIVRDASFTPERIRRFVLESLPSLVVEMQTGSLTTHKIRLRIQDAIRNAPERTKKTFRALGDAHKWLLISLLEADKWDKGGTVRLFYDNYCPDELRLPFNDVLEDVSEAFIRIEHSRIAWVHPSYRDLVIEELASSPVLKSRFLARMSLAGLKLAISDTGGVTGERKFPLVDTEKSWDLTGQRAMDLLGKDDNALPILLSFRGAISEADESERRLVLKTAAKVCEQMRENWNISKLPVDPANLRAYFDVTALVHPIPLGPDLNASWQESDRSFREELEYAEQHAHAIPAEMLTEWIEMLETLAKYAPEFLKKQGFPDSFEAIISRVLASIKKEFGSDTYLFDPIEDEDDPLLEEADEAEGLANGLKRLQRLTPSHSKQMNKVIADLIGRTESIRGQSCGDEQDIRSDDRRTDSFNIESLFSEL